MSEKDLNMQDLKNNNTFLDLINRANYYVEKYYNYEIDLDTLHENLYRLFGSYKYAVDWFYNYAKNMKK